METAIHRCSILKCFSMLARATAYLFQKEYCTVVPVSELTGPFLFISTCGILVCFLVFHILLIPFPVRFHSLGLEQVLFRTDECLYRYRLRSAFSNSHKWFLSDPFRYHQLQNITEGCVEHILSVQNANTFGHKHKFSLTLLCPEGTDLLNWLVFSTYSPHSSILLSMVSYKVFDKTC